jgi:uncharacterized protein
MHIRHNNITPGLKKNALPVQPGERIAFVDILRGFAVFGILVANMAGFSGYSTYIESLNPGIDRTIIILIRFLVVAKFYSLFSFLFGWGMAIQMERAAARSTNFVPIYVRRLLILLGVGIIHGVLIWSGDILTLYALLGLILILFRNRSEKFLLISIILCLLFSIFLTVPGQIMDNFRLWYEEITSFLRSTNLPENLFARGTYVEITQLRIQDYLSGLSRSLYSFGNVFAMFLLGLYVGKRRIFQEVDQHLTLIRKTLILGLLFGVTFHGLWIWSTIHPGWLPFDWIPVDYSRMLQRTYYTIGAATIMLFYVSGFILILRRESIHDQLAPLGNVGRMALSNYLLQSIVATLIFYNYGLGLYNQISPTFGLILTIIIFLAQIKFSGWWFERFKFGPVERLWRMLTYLKWQPTQSGEPVVEYTHKPKFQTLKSIYTKIGPYPILITSWLLLIIWGAILFNWNIHLSRTNNQVLTQILANQSPQQTISTTSQLGDNAQNTSANTSVVTIPKVKPATYNPSRLAASGDVLALSATFNLDRAIDEIKTLSSDQYNGRYAGSPGGEAAGDYIAKQFAASGLQPMGIEGTYFQPFSTTFTPLSAIPTLIVQSSDGKLIDKYNLYEDYSPIIKWYAGPGSGSGKVYWAVDCSNENFAGIDVVGKIVMCNPGDDDNWLAETSRNALENGAIGLLFVTDPSSRPPDMGSTIKDVWVPNPIPTFWIYPNVIEDILTGSTITVSDILATESPFQLETSVIFDLKISEAATCPGRGCIGRNVLGILPGRDPNYSDEAIILGAHYDHLGKGPDGTVWSGANDNASGVAVLLEIAQRWHKYGYIPRRTIIFAAWDAEEMGLIGSIYYVNNPTYPLRETIAMIQLDMVGAGGEILTIDGDQNLSERIHHSAEMFGVQADISSFGRSDHVPFLEAGVPASLIIWMDSETTISHYHRPIDTASIIESKKLKAAAQIAEVTALNIIESEPAIIDMLKNRATAAVNSDEAEFLETSNFDQHNIDRQWLSDFQLLNPLGFKLSTNNMIFSGNEATAQVNYSIVYPSSENESFTQTLNTQLAIKFEHSIDGWVWSGPNLTWVNEDEQIDNQSQQLVKVAHPPDINTDLSSLSQSVAERYKEIATLLELPVELNSKLLLLPDHKSLRTSASLLLPESQTTVVIPGEIRLIFDEQITATVQLDDALANLILADRGISEANLPWLWQGLPLLLQEYKDSLTVQSRYIPVLQDMFRSGEIEANPASAWAATKYLQQRLGWRGLGLFITEVGQNCAQDICFSDEALDAAFLKHVQLDTESFEQEWQRYWSNRIQSAQDELDIIIAKRSDAISANNQRAFLANINQDVPSLIQEEAHWIDNLDPKIKNTLTIKAKPLALLRDGNILAKVTYTYHPNGNSTPDEVETISQKILFLHTETGYLWSGPLMESLAGKQVQINYPPKNEGIAYDLLNISEEVYPSIVSTLGISTTETVNISLYASQDEFVSSINLSMADNNRITAWTAPGESIKLKIIGDREGKEYKPVLIEQIIRGLLLQQDVDSEWIIQGLSSYLSRKFDQGAVQKSLAATLPEIADTSPTIRLNAIASQNSQTNDNVLINQTIAWDATKYLIETYGWEKLINILKYQGEGDNIEIAISRSLGKDFNSFEAEWRQSLVNNHIIPGHIDIANEFDQELAMEHVHRLTSQGMAGRKAGSQGAAIAADYIASRFEDYGLLPIGEQAKNEENDDNSFSNPHSPTELSGLLQSTTSISTFNPSYYQSFPISYTENIPTPSLELNFINSLSNSKYIYQEDFIAVKATIGTNRVTSGDLVWIGENDYHEPDIEGKILLRIPKNDLGAEIAEAANQGAKGILFIGNKKDEADILIKDLYRTLTNQEINIPAFELTQTGYSKLLESLGYNRLTIRELPPGFNLEILAKLDYQIETPHTANTTNVLGYLPGSDPYLKREFIIIGAHYDHVGDDTNGLRYSGANDNASGVGVLLEIARLWHQTGYKPKRSVLFAAWGAQEMGQAGSLHFISHSTVPVENIIAMLQLDGVGGGEGFNLGAHGTWEEDGFILYNLSAASSSINEKLIFTPSMIESDHVSFHQADIPAVLIAWRLANEDNLPDSIAQAVHPTRIGTSGRITTLTLMNMAR